MEILMDHKMTVVLAALIAMNVVSCRKDFNKFLNRENSMFNEEKAGNDEVETLSKSGRNQYYRGS